MVTVTEKHRRNMSANLRKFFDLSFWKRVRREFQDFEAARIRWDLRMSLFAGLLVQILPGDCERERFEYARAVLATLFNKRRRCGKTFEGFTTALGALPLEFLDCVREALQAAVLRAGLRPGQLGRWEVYGLDGSKEDLPRTEAHENHYGVVTKSSAASQGTAQRLVVAAVDLRYYLAWDWASFSAIGSERELALNLIARMNPGALAVCDAGFIGYTWAQQVRASGHHFLVRVGGNARLWVERLPNAEYRDGQVWLWPDAAHRQAPIVLRLIRLWITCQTDRRKQEEMWLATDVLDETALTTEEARRFYRKRWPGNECTFRTWKHTLAAAKLNSRIPETAEREAELSLCALLMIQASVLCARRERRKMGKRVSVAQAQRVWRKIALQLVGPRSMRANWFEEALRVCEVDSYHRRNGKVKRPWPQRKEHRTPGAPILRKLDLATKTLGLKRLAEQQRVAS